MLKYKQSSIDYCRENQRVDQSRFRKAKRPYRSSRQSCSLQVPSRVRSTYRIHVTPYLATYKAV
jgi:hypothetical protein